MNEIPYRQTAAYRAALIAAAFQNAVTRRAARPGRILGVPAPARLYMRRYSFGHIRMEDFGGPNFWNS